jgi:hypothetical protein
LNTANFYYIKRALKHKKCKRKNSIVTSKALKESKTKAASSQQTKAPKKTGKKKEERNSRPASPTTILQLVSNLSCKTCYMKTIYPYARFASIIEHPDACENLPSVYKPQLL